MDNPKQNIILILILQTILLVLFGIFAKYASSHQETNTYANPFNLAVRKMKRFRQYLKKNKRSSTISNRNPDIEKIVRLKFGLITMFVQLIISLVFYIFCEYAPKADARNEHNSIGPTFGGFNQKQLDAPYFMFQDVHVMVFIGFGFLMTFLKKYGYSAVGFNFLLGALTIQWAMICQGFYRLNDNYKIEIGIDSLYEADIAAAAVLISMGAVLGRTSYLQLLVMGIFEILFLAPNSFIGNHFFQVSDAGGSIFIHTFGAYFGLSVSYSLQFRKSKTLDNSLQEARYTSDIFAMIGTIFLWIFWPSFNAIELTGDDQQRAVINTYLSLAACCVTTFALSVIFTENRKFDMVHIQNSTLAGGVAVGTSANLMLQPSGAVLVGIIAAIISVAGYAKLTPWLGAKLNLGDTCGVHNLHGMPGVLAGVIGAFMAAIASEDSYSKTLYEIYPARASPNMSATAEYIFLKPGLGRSALEQAGYQMLAVGVTLIFAVISGLITGLILRLLKLDTLSHEKHYDDAISWVLPQHETSMKKTSVENSHFDNASFEPTIVSGALTDVAS